MSALPIARLFGFEIRVHVSWAIILAVITVSVVGEVGETAPQTATATRWLIGAAVAASFLLSALAHELGHAMMARRAGFPGGPVIVYFFGGAASAVLEGRRPRDEIAVAVAGPIVSLALGAIALAVAAIATELGGAVLVAIGQVALVVGVLDLILGSVNLLPAYPLDGGRVVRAIGWARTGDPGEGLRIAARTGRWLGVALAVVGTAVILAVDQVDGLMLALCGWFLVSSSGAVQRTAGVERLLEGIRVADIMDRGANRIPAGVTLDTFGDQVLTGAGDAVSVMDGAEVVGLLGSRQVRGIRRDRWATTRAGDVMARADTLPTIVPETTVRAALEHLQRTGLDGLPVTEAGAITGVVTRRAVADAIRARASGRAVPS